MTSRQPRGTEVDQELVEAWQAVARPYLDIRARWFDTAADVGLTPAGLDALLKVDPDEAPTMRRMAELLGCDASYVTAMVDDLEKAGLAARRPDAKDRRIKTIELTPAGRQAQQHARDRLVAPPPELGNLSRSQQHTLARLLHQALE
jgi:DNA-binding MarR family transcriptional regulator